MGDITPDHVSHLPERMAIRKDLMAVLRESVVIARVFLTFCILMEGGFLKEIQDRLKIQRQETVKSVFY